MNSRGRHTGDYNGSRSNSSHNDNRHNSSLNGADEADLESFKAALKELTFNSRPVIEKLTGMARERARSIPGQVSRSILDNLVFNNPKLRSCFLFLIDSICKNVGEPYPTSFVKHGLVSAYIRVYGEVWASGDEGQKRDFLRVLPTWNGVIAPEALKQIEVKLGLPISTAAITVKSNTGSPVKANIVSRVENVNNGLPVKDVSTATSSAPVYSRATLKLLQDLQGVFEKPPGPHISGIVSEIFRRLARGGELKREIIEELDFKAKMGDKGQVIEALKRIQRACDDIEVTRAQPVTLTTTTSSSTPSSAATSSFNFELPSDFQIDLSLLSSIVELNKLNTNALSSSSSIPQSPTIKEKMMPLDKHFVDIPVNSVDLLTTHPTLYQVLYADLSLQCKTCAIRFRNTPRGQERLTEHLDSHFRRNMRLKEKSKRVMARDWFGSELDWIEAKKDSEISSERAVHIFQDSLAGSVEGSQPPETDIFVEASEEEQSEVIKCDTCQETVSLAWNDEIEQWTFPGCIKNDFGKIVHAACQQQGEIKTEEDKVIKPPSKRVKKN